MKKFRLFLICIASVIIITSLTLVDHNNYQWSNNSGNYLVIISMVFLILSMLLSNRYEADSGRQS